MATHMQEIHVKHPRVVINNRGYELLTLQVVCFSRWEIHHLGNLLHMYAYVVKIKFFLINTDTGHRAKETDLFFGIDHSRLFLALQHKLLCVLKAVLLEAKVLVQSSASACSLERSMISECSTCSTVKCF